MSAPKNCLPNYLLVFPLPPFLPSPKKVGKEIGFLVSKKSGKKSGSDLLVYSYSKEVIFEAKTPVIPPCTIYAPRQKRVSRGPVVG